MLDLWGCGRGLLHERMYGSRRLTDSKSVEMVNDPWMSHASLAAADGTLWASKDSNCRRNIGG